MSSVNHQLRLIEQEAGDTRGAAGGEPPAPAQSVEPSDPTRVRVRELLTAGASRAEIARRLGIAKSTVSYHARRLGAAVDVATARRFDWTAIQARYDAGMTVRECAAEFGFSMNAWHLAIRRGAISPRPAFKPADDIFARGTRRNRGHLKRRLLSAGLREARCELCGLDEWRGAALSVALHHLNGDRLDNRIENLQLLCPNCHSQTENFAGRNRQNAATTLQIRKTPNEASLSPGG